MIKKRHCSNYKCNRLHDPVEVEYTSNTFCQFEAFVNLLNENVYYKFMNMFKKHLHSFMMHQQ
jgi:hypothetical protein